jgi:hypothetical protein
MSLLKVHPSFPEDENAAVCKSLPADRCFVVERLERNFQPGREGFK